MLTPQKIQDLADPIESVYIHMTEELLANIGKHITSPTWTHTARWEIQKLSELGQLTRENAEIINKWIESIPDEIRETMEATRKDALAGIEKQLSQAAEDGYVTPPAADSSVAVMEDLAAQATERLNLVNTTMLQSSLDQYARAVQITEACVRRAEATQAILNEGAASVSSGAETRTQAVRRAIKRIADEGLTGFIDRAGRSWSPEAYVNMDIRTTVHNVAIQSTKSRMQDFGTQVFQISSHAGARPLCYPYQGKFYSWDGTEGDVELGNGRFVHYEPIGVTSYGQPAGIFGINCGHFPIPVVPGVTIPHGADNIQPKEENDKAYAESQEQRRLEREIREAKRVVEMAGGLATDADRKAVKDAQADMRKFIAETGRTRRYDREQITLPDRSVSSAQSRDTIGRAEPAKVFSSGTEADRFFKAESAMLSENTAAGRAFNYYTSEGYTPINRLLRGQFDAVLPSQAADADNAIPVMRNWIAQQTLSEPITVYRTMPESVYTQITQAGIYWDKGFTSAATVFEAVEGGVPEQKSLWLELEIPSGQGRGAYIDSVSEFSGAEFEYLIHDNAQFIITGERADDEGRRIITGRLVE